MIRYARITRCMKMTEQSPGWRTPDQFKMVAAERYLKTYSGILPAEFTDRALIEEYVISWNNARDKFNAKEHLVKGKLSFSNNTSHFFVLLFDSPDSLASRKAFIESSVELQRFEAARQALADFLQVKIDVYEPVELDTDMVIDADVLTVITNGLDQTRP